MNDLSLAVRLAAEFSDWLQMQPDVPNPNPVYLRSMRLRFVQHVLSRPLASSAVPL